MRKKWLILAVLSSMLFLSLAGCTSKNSGAKAKKATLEENQPTVLYVTRHGKTMLNTLDRVQGWADTPLTPEGIAVAADLGEGLKKEEVEFKAVYSSDLGRAKQTAQTVLDKMGAPDLEITEMPGLREACYGMFEGDFNKNMMAAIVKENKLASAEELTGLGMEMWRLSADTLNTIDELKMAESSATIIERMKESIEKIASDTEKNGGGNVLVVGHGMSISLLLSELSDLPFEGHLANASVSKIIYEDGKLTVESIGDTSYIEAEK